MKPIVAIVGRPNVGKSTLFNRLTRSRDAIVADYAGLTRDRHYGNAKFDGREFICIDTGGFEPIVKEGILREMAKQTLQAIDEADVVIFLTDGRSGLTRHDFDIAETLRKRGRPVVLAVNKTEGMALTGVTSVFYELGLGEPHPLSSAHGDGVRSVLEQVFQNLPAPETQQESDAESEEADRGPRTPRIAIVGRPNVGKSTLINSLVGEERVIAFDAPGTTRDAIEVPFTRGGKPYVLIDTAGLRRKGKVFEAIEKFSVVKTLQAIDDCNVAILMIDAREAITDQDAHIAGYVLETGRAIVVALNKWDDMDDQARELARSELRRKLAFLHFANVHNVSALKSHGLGALMQSVDGAFAAAFAKLSTPKLTRALQAAVEQQQPARKGLHRPKLRYAHQGGQNPPLIVIHGNALDGVSAAYRRYLEGRFRETFKLPGTPLRIEFRSSSNPFTD
ncbi:ribosome biogenesis GTPase Der [Piscinibacterium candidicorallinum]|uniref:GTPase Der n=1 Tax=Piscinibacterium candidicorallinum TaxID=1793872 RepID=A0ABV7H1V6_9BURK